jgi:hypothetical protein
MRLVLHMVLTVALFAAAVILAGCGAVQVPRW